MRVAKIEGLEDVNRKLREFANASRQKDNGSVVVGYSQSYALYVHEVPMRHKPGKSWKYLEIPFRLIAPTVLSTVKTVYRRTGSIIKGLMIVGLRLQRESQLIVPVDTGALRASAYTRKEKK